LEEKKKELIKELKKYGYFLRAGFGGSWTIDVPGYGDIIPFYQIFPTKVKKKKLLKQTGFSKEELSN